MTESKQSFEFAIQLKESKRGKEPIYENDKEIHAEKVKQTVESNRRKNKRNWIFQMN
jgi:hypothetical protein